MGLLSGLRYAFPPQTSPGLPLAFHGRQVGDNVSCFIFYILPRRTLPQQYRHIRLHTANDPTSSLRKTNTQCTAAGEAQKAKHHITEKLT